MKTALIAFVVAMTVPAAASAWEKQFRDTYIPDGCTTEVCQNPYNEKFNSAFAKGDMKTALKYCREINRLDVPALPMPDAYVACAEAGSIRKMGALAGYYRETNQRPDLVFYWASKGAQERNEKLGKWEVQLPHPDSKIAWRELCRAYAEGIGTKKSLKEASLACSKGGREWGFFNEKMRDRRITADTPVSDPVAERLYREVQDEIEFRNRDAAAAEHLEKENLIHSIRKNAERSFR